MTAGVECLACRRNEVAEPPPRERIVTDESWRVVHAFNSRLPGWLVVVARRHVETLADLTPGEAARLGTLLRQLTAALVTVLGCDKTYVALFAEQEGFNHVHVHVVPRMPDQPAELRGPRIFQLLDAPDSERVPEDEMDRLGARLTQALGPRM